MKQRVYIFAGHSGAGKGTQVELFKKKAQTLFPDIPVLHVQTGNMFRALVQKDTETAKRVKVLIDQGLLPPAFLGVYAWSEMLITEYTGAQIVCIDGTPRIPEEVPLLTGLFDFYEWDPHIIHIKVGDEWAFEHMKGRGRADDKDDEDVHHRISWFHTSVFPAIEALARHPRVTLHTVNGEQTIEKVHEDVCKELGLGC